jgi:putative transposase
MARRCQKERKASPSAIAVDSQSVKVTAGRPRSFVREDTGIDGNKRLKGRKRHLAVDALGYPIALLVTGADVSDTEAGKTLADRVATKLNDWSVRYHFPTRLALVRADAGYKNSFVDRVTQAYDWLVDIAQKPESAKGFVPQAGRWQVERSYGWLNFRRRLSRDYEKTVESSEAMLHLAFISFLLPKVAT